MTQTIDICGSSAYWTHDHNTDHSRMDGYRAILRKVPFLQRVTRIDAEPTTQQTRTIVCRVRRYRHHQASFRFRVRDALRRPMHGSATGPDCECSCGGHQHGANR